MTVGTKSLLFGVHQFIWHPLTVLFAWLYLYRSFPNWRELVCIVIHDWGYWGSSNMDGPEGERHPERAASIAMRIFGSYYSDLCLLHSRRYARSKGLVPSKLCWADKFSIACDPCWFYLTRAWLSGELYEYRESTALEGFIPLSDGHRQWFRWVRARLVSQGVKNISDI